MAGLFSKAMEQIFESEPEQKVGENLSNKASPPGGASVPAPVQQPAVSFDPAATVRYVPMDPASDPLYRHLLGVTDTEKIPVLMTLASFAKPLEDIIPDKATRMKAALKQAISQNRLEPNDVRVALDGLRLQLTAELQKFKESVEARRQEIENVRQLIAAKEAEVASLKLDLTSKTGVFNAAQQRFDAAYTRRQDEIDSFVADFSAYIK